MLSAIYASASAILILWLSYKVIKIRRKFKISIGNGNNEELIHAITAQTNAIEYVPIALILLFAMEFNQANILIVHCLGLVFLFGRVLHARSILTKNLKLRIFSTKITIYTLLGMVACNLIYIPYTKLYIV